MKIILWLTMIVSLLGMLPMAWIALQWPMAIFGLVALGGMGWFAAQAADTYDL